jgi:hypothetical protein
MRESESKLEWWLESQMLRQESEMECGVHVFGALANLSRSEIVSDMPDAVNGKTLDQWEAYLNGKGWEMTRHQPGEKHPQPCAHLHQIVPGYNHWVFQAEDGGIHDPNPACQHCPPKMLQLSSYNVILSVTIKMRSKAT